MDGQLQQLGTAFVSHPDKYSKPQGFLGEGCFGAVFEATIPGFVVKMVDRFWIDGWFPWALYCMKHAGEVGIPTIAAMRLDFQTGKLWALMERLESATWGQNPRVIRCEKANFEENVRRSFGNLKTVPKHLRTVMEDLPEQNFRLDLHRYNTMFRGNKQIVTDPFLLVGPDNCWLKDMGIAGDILSLGWARQTLNVYLPKPDPRVLVIGNPEEKIQHLSAIEERERELMKSKKELRRQWPNPALP